MFNNIAGKLESIDPKVKVAIAVLGLVIVVAVVARKKQPQTVTETVVDSTPDFSGGSYPVANNYGGSPSGTGPDPLAQLNAQYDAEYNQAKRLFGLDKDRATFESDLQKQVATFATDEANRRQLNEINADYIHGRNDIDLSTEATKRQNQLALENQAANFDFLFGSQWAKPGNTTLPAIQPVAPAVPKDSDYVNIFGKKILKSDWNKAK